MWFLQPYLPFAGGHSTLTFEMYKKKKRDEFYQKYLRDKFLFKRITIIRLTIGYHSYIMFTGSFDIKQSDFIWIYNSSA